MRERLDHTAVASREPVPRCVVIEDDETDARLWEIAENLHRAELTALERDEHIAEWVRLTEEKAKAAGSEEKLVQVGPVSSKGGRGKKGGIRAAERELGLKHANVARAIRVAGITPEAKEAACEAGLDDNQSALLAVARAGRTARRRRVRDRRVMAVRSKAAPLVTSGPLAFEASARGGGYEPRRTGNLSLSREARKGVPGSPHRPGSGSGKWALTEGQNGH